MAEAEWLACTDPRKMLEIVQGKATDRKLRLFTCAYARRVWGLLKARRKVRSFEIAERYVDGEGSPDDLREAYRRVEQWRYASPDPIALGLACQRPLFHQEDDFSRRRGLEYTLQASLHTARKLWRGPDGRQFRGRDFPDHATANEAIRSHLLVELTAQTTLLRDIFGNPYRPLPPLTPAVLGWNDRTIPRIAEGIYEERRMPGGTLETGRLAILADALLDAGCEDEDLIQHCQEAGPHVRGCWAVDLILGKS